MKKEAKQDKLDQLKKVAGEIDVDKVAKEIDNDFIPDVYDKTMGQAFGEKFYNLANDDDKELAD